MSFGVTLGGVNYSLPGHGDAWSLSTTDFCRQVTLTPYWVSPGQKPTQKQPAQSGYYRFCGGDVGVAWRNAGNTADLGLSKDVNDKLLFGSQYLTGQPFLYILSSTGPTLITGVVTILTFGGLVLAFIDTDAATGSGFNRQTGRYTVPPGKGGRYLVAVQVNMVQTVVAATTINFRASVWVNAVETAGIEWNVLTFASAAGGIHGFRGSTIVNVNAGDLIDVRAFQDSGATLIAGSANLQIKRLVS